MINKLKVLVFVTIFASFLTNVANSDEKYCIDEKGLILPLFDETKCTNTSDIEINQEEFTYIIEFNTTERLTKLQDFRKNKDEILKAKEESEDLGNEQEEIKKKEIAKKQKEKQIASQKEIDQKKTERLAKIEKRKKE